MHYQCSKYRKISMDLQYQKTLKAKRILLPLKNIISRRNLKKRKDIYVIFNNHWYFDYLLFINLILSQACKLILIWIGIYTILGYKKYKNYTFFFFEFQRKKKCMNMLEKLLLNSLVT